MKERKENVYIYINGSISYLSKMNIDQIKQLLKDAEEIERNTANDQAER